MADLRIKGLSELNRTLQNLPVKLEKNISRGALRAGAKVIADEAKVQVPVKSGDLRESIRVSAGAKKNGRVYANIYAGGGKAFYARFVEFGTKRHVIVAGVGKSGMMKVLAVAGRILGSKVDHPGAKKQPFMRPAFDNKAVAAIDTMADYMRTRLDKLK